MKTFLLFIISFFISLGYGQNKKDSFLLEKNELYPIESFRDLKTGTISLDKNGFPEFQSVSNFGIKNTLPQSFQSNSRVLSKQGNYSLRLDSYVYVYLNKSSLSNKEEVTYDINGQQTLYLGYTWNTVTLSFVPSSKFESIYDVNGNQTLDIYYSWDIATESFLPTGKQEYTYDVNKKQSFFIQYEWNSVTESFVPYNKFEYIYGLNGIQTLGINYNWDATNQSFVTSSKQELTYDANGNQTLIIYYSWDIATESFLPTNKHEYTYDVNGNQTLYIGYRWDTGTQSFVAYDMQESTFNLDGNLTLYIQYNWNTETQSFVPYYKFENNYDINGNQTLYIRYSWNIATQSIVPAVKFEYTYDANGNKMLMTTYLWHDDLGVYKPSFKQEYSNILDNETKLVRIGTTFKYDTNFNRWYELVGEEYKSYYYYTKTSILSTEEFKGTSFLLHPNPTSDYIIIKTTEQLSNLQLEVFDISGKRVLSKPINSTESINIQNLTPATYLYHIKDGESILKSGKIIKE